MAIFKLSDLLFVLPTCIFIHCQDDLLHKGYFCSYKTQIGGSRISVWTNFWHFHADLKTPIVSYSNFQSILKPFNGRVLEHNWIQSSSIYNQKVRLPRQDWLKQKGPLNVDLNMFTIVSSEKAIHRLLKVLCNVFLTLQRNFSLSSKWSRIFVSRWYFCAFVFILATHTGSTNLLPTTSLDKDRFDS